MRLIAEADMPLSRYPPAGPNPAVPVAGLSQFYFATVSQWNFDVRRMLGRH